jgi:hypothetical protein
MNDNIESRLASIERKLDALSDLVEAKLDALPGEDALQANWKKFTRDALKSMTAHQNDSPSKTSPQGVGKGGADAPRPVLGTTEFDKAEEKAREARPLQDERYELKPIDPDRIDLDAYFPSNKKPKGL